MDAKGARIPGGVAALAFPAPSIAETRRGPVEYASSGEGPAVIALHGAMGGYDQSLLLAWTVAGPGFRVLALSRPGYLGTPLDAGRSPEEQADLYAEALDALGVRRVAVLAVSGGGPSAIQFALRHRDRCWGLVLVSTCATRVETRIPASFHLVKLLTRWPWFADAMRRRAERNPERGHRRSIRDPALRDRTLRHPEARPLLDALLRSTLDRAALRLPGTENDIAVSRSAEYPLEQIAVPVLVVHGTADRMVPFERHGRSLAARVPGAELLALEGGEHAAIFTHRDEVQARVTRFLGERASASSPAGPLAAGSPGEKNEGGSGKPLTSRVATV